MLCCFCCCNDSNIGQDLLLLIKLIISLELSNGAATPTPGASPTLKTALLHLFIHKISVSENGLITLLLPSCSFSMKIEQDALQSFGDLLTTTKMFE